MKGGLWAPTRGRTHTAEVDSTLLTTSTPMPDDMDIDLTMSLPGGDMFEEATELFEQAAKGDCPCICASCPKLTLVAKR